MTTRRTHIITGIVVVSLVLVGVLSLIAVTTRSRALPADEDPVSPPSAAASAAHSASPTPSPMTSPSPAQVSAQGPVSADPAVVQAGVSALESIPADPQAGVSSQASDYFGIDPADLLPLGTTIKADAATWTQLDESTALVRIDVATPDGVTTPYSAVMVDEGGTWKLMATLDVDDDNSDQ